MTKDKPFSTNFEIKKVVREHYARAVTSMPKDKSCGCGSGCCSSDSASFSSVQKLYEDPDVGELPEDVTSISLGCGDPVSLAALRRGQIVLDLGSGGGIDCFLAGKKVGAEGHVIGVDMTPEMIDRARANCQKLGAENVEFRLGEIEHLPVADRSVDVVISNCVINLSPDKGQVFREIHRVLKPGGRMAVSDIVTDGDLPSEIKTDLSAWAGCVAGALDIQDYLELIRQAGLVNAGYTPVYFDEGVIAESAENMKKAADIETLRKTIFSARITAEKEK